MKTFHVVSFIMTVFMLTWVSPNIAWAHCDGLDGPVVTLARQALSSGNVNLVLPWVPASDEPEIRHAFDHAVAVRKLGEDAQRLADRFFFETLVRVHRASEGAPYTGLKPAGINLGPAILVADRALDTGAIEEVENLLADAMHKGLRQHFRQVSEQKDFDPNNVRAGRRYVQAYVPYVHYVEGLWQQATGSVEGHYPEPTQHAH